MQALYFSNLTRSRGCATAYHARSRALRPGRCRPLPPHQKKRRENRGAITGGARLRRGAGKPAAAMRESFHVLLAVRHIHPTALSNSQFDPDQQKRAQTATFARAFRRCGRRRRASASRYSSMVRRRARPGAHPHHAFQRLARAGPPAARRARARPQRSPGSHSPR